MSPHGNRARARARATDAERCVGTVSGHYSATAADTLSCGVQCCERGGMAAASWPAASQSARSTGAASGLVASSTGGSLNGSTSAAHSILSLRMARNCSGISISAATAKAISGLPLFSAQILLKLTNWKLSNLREGSESSNLQQATGSQDSARAAE